MFIKRVLRYLHFKPCTSLVNDQKVPVNVVPRDYDRQEIVIRGKKRGGGISPPLFDGNSVRCYSSYFFTSASIPRTIRPIPMVNLIISGNTRTRMPRTMAITPTHKPLIFKMVPLLNLMIDYTIILLEESINYRRSE
jgi:hypothetical protein